MSSYASPLQHLCIRLVKIKNEDYQVQFKCLHLCANRGTFLKFYGKNEVLMWRRGKKQRKSKSASIWRISPHRQMTPHLHLISYYTFISRFLYWFGREQGMLGRVRLLGIRNEQPDFLVCSSPLRVQLTVVAERHLHRQIKEDDGNCTSGWTRHSWSYKFMLTAK